MIPGLGRSPGEGISYALQFSVLGKSMDRGAWQATAHGVAQSPTGLTQLSTHPDPSSKATLWVKAQHEGALPPPCIVRKDPRVLKGVKPPVLFG